MCENTATWRLLGGARGAGASTGGGEGRGHIVSPRAQLVSVATVANTITTSVAVAVAAVCRWCKCTYHGETVLC